MQFVRESCKASVPEHFSKRVYPLLQQLVLQDQFAYGCLSMRKGSFRFINFRRFSHQTSDLRHTQDMSAIYPLTRDWLERQQPVYWALMKHRVPTFTKKDYRHLTNLLGINIDNIAIHGVIGPTGINASIFVFANLRKQWHQELAQLLEQVVPYLHIVLMPLPYGEDCDIKGKSLSQREREVLRQLLHGKSNPEIGGNLGISPYTARIHVQNVMRKLGATNRTELAVIAIQLGFDGLNSGDYDSSGVIVTDMS